MELKKLIAEKAKEYGSTLGIGIPAFRESIFLQVMQSPEALAVIKSCIKAAIVEGIDTQETEHIPALWLDEDWFAELIQDLK